MICLLIIYLRKYIILISDKTIERKVNKMKKTIISKTLWNTDIFEVVNKIPVGYFIWNIGDNMGHDDYIPLCENLYQGLKKSDPEYYSINQDTLKAIKLDLKEVKLLRKAASYGICSKKNALSAIKRNAKSSYQKRKKTLAEQTINIFERITE